MQNLARARPLPASGLFCFAQNAGLLNETAIGRFDPLDGKRWSRRRIFGVMCTGRRRKHVVPAHLFFMSMEETTSIAPEFLQANSSAARVSTREESPQRRSRLGPRAIAPGTL